MSEQMEIVPESRDSSVITVTEGITFSLDGKEYHSIGQETRKLGGVLARHFTVFLDKPVLLVGGKELKIVLRLRELDPSSSENNKSMTRDVVLKAYALSTDMNVTNNNKMFCAVASANGEGKTEFTLVNSITLNDANRPGSDPDMSEDIREKMIKDAVGYGVWQLAFMDESRGIMAVATPVIPMSLAKTFSSNQTFDQIVSKLHEAIRESDALFVRVIDDFI